VSEKMVWAKIAHTKDSQLTESLARMEVAMEMQSEMVASVRSQAESFSVRKMTPVNDA
jgi:hypothetical protein